MVISAEGMTRTAREWSAIAGEELTLEQIRGTLYAFGSELAVLRLFYKMQVRSRVQYSKNLRTWAFSKDLDGPQEEC